MGWVYYLGSPARAGLIFGLLSVLGTVMLRVAFRSLSTEEELSPLDLYDMLSFQVDFVFLGLGVLFGAFVEWLRRRASSSFAGDPRNWDEIIFFAWTFLALMTTIFGIIVILFGAGAWPLNLPGSFVEWPYGDYTLAEVVLLRLIVFNLLGAGILWVCGTAALKAPQ